MGYKILAVVVTIILFYSCSTDSKTVTSSSIGFDTDSISLKLKYAENSFVVPSPNQTAILLKKCNIQYYNQFTNQDEKLENYTTTTKKSLALGIFGADLSYLNLYEQRETAGKYLQKVQSLMDDLEISVSLDKDFLKRMDTNFGNNDSVLYYLAKLYRSGDLNLKANDRRDICSLIIAGGWIESFYFLTELYQKTRNEEIFRLILYQSDILDNLIKILAPFYEKSTEYTTLIDDLVNIAYEFDVIDKVPSTLTVETDSVNQKTVVHNQTKHLISGTKLNNIAKYASNLRNKILL